MTPSETEFIADAAADWSASDNVNRDRVAVMGVGGFLLHAGRRPGAYIQIGNGDGAGGCEVHNPGYDFNDAAIPYGAGILAAVVEKELPKPA